MAHQMSSCEKVTWEPLGPDDPKILSIFSVIDSNEQIKNAIEFCLKEEREYRMTCSDRNLAAAQMVLLDVNRFDELLYCSTATLFCDSPFYDSNPPRGSIPDKLVAVPHCGILMAIFAEIKLLGKINKTLDFAYFDIHAKKCLCDSEKFDFAKRKTVGDIQEIINCFGWSYEPTRAQYIYSMLIEHISCGDFDGAGKIASEINASKIDRCRIEAYYRELHHD